MEKSKENYEEEKGEGREKGKQRKSINTFFYSVFFGCMCVCVYVYM